MGSEYFVIIQNQFPNRIQVLIWHKSCYFKYEEYVLRILLRHLGSLRKPVFGQIQLRRNRKLIKYL